MHNLNRPGRFPGEASLAVDAPKNLAVNVACPSAKIFDECPLAFATHMALIATRTRKTGAGSNKHTVRLGQMVAVEGIMRFESHKRTQEQLTYAYKQGGGSWRGNYRIAFVKRAATTPQESHHV